MYIGPFTSLADSPVFFMHKKDRSLCLCVNNSRLNLITKKSRYFLLLIGEAEDCLLGAKDFTKLGIQDMYDHVRIRKGNN